MTSFDATPDGKKKRGWPSGPRRSTQVRVSSETWVRTPLHAGEALILHANLGSLAIELLKQKILVHGKVKYFFGGGNFVYSRRFCQHFKSSYNVYSVWQHERVL